MKAITRLMTILTFIGWAGTSNAGLITLNFTGLCDDCAGNNPLETPWLNLSDGIYQEVAEHSCCKIMFLVTRLTP